METGTKIAIGVLSAAAVGGIVYFGFIKKTDGLVAAPPTGGGVADTPKTELTAEEASKLVKGYYGSPKAKMLPPTPEQIANNLKIDKQLSDAGWERFASGAMLNYGARKKISGGVLSSVDGWRS